jgi:hypothetical protein
MPLNEMRDRLRLLSKISTLILFIVVCALKMHAQSYPVQANIALAPPYSPFLADYTAAGAQVFTSTLYLRDSRISNYQVKLRLTIEGVGITIRTKANYIPLRPITLFGGESLTMFGEDLEEYFDPNNLDFAGISKSQYEKGAKLPEGVYRFTLEVLDYNRNTLVSNKGTAVAWIILNDPPLLNLPRTDTKVKIIDPTNVVFTWSPRHTGSPNAAFTSEYIFKLVEIWPATRNPYDAFLSQQPLYEITTSFTQVVYGPAEPALIPGRKYAWQVQVKDTEGRDLFKNQGKSEVYVFQFGDAMGIPQNFRKDAGSNSSVVNLRWEPASDGAIPEQYRVRYRKKGDTRSVWYESVTPQLWSPIPDLKADTEYEMQVRAEAAFQYSDYSALATFRTETSTTTPYTCGAKAVILPTTNANPLLALAPGEIISCRNYKLLVTEVTGSNGSYTGKGWLKMKWFNGAGIKANFSGQINTDRVLIVGSIETVYNQGSPAAQAIDDANNIGKDTDQLFEKKDSAVAVTSDYTVPGSIDSIYVKDDGKIIVVDTEGNESTFEPKKDEKTGKAKDTIIADAAGNSYTVGEDGKVTKKEGGTTANTQAAIAQVDPIKDKIIVQILERFGDQISAWLKVNGKGGEEDDEVLLAAELSSCFPQNENILSHINDVTIPYYKKEENTPELREKIESDSDIKELLSKIASKFSNRDVVDINKASEEDQDKLTNALCSATIDADINLFDSEFTAQVGADKKGSSCFMQGFNRAKELYGEYESGIAIYGGFLRFSICETEKQNCGQDGGVAAYSCGLTNGLLQEIDWLFLLESEGITKEDIANLILCVKDSYPIGGNAEDNPELPKVVFKCITGVELGDMGNAIKDFIVKNWDEPYYQGQATAFVLTLISPYKGKIVEKLAALPEYAAKLNKFKSLSKAKNGDELVVIAKSLANVVDDLAYANLAVKQTINLTSFVAKKSDSYIDVIVHFSNGKFKAIVEEAGSFVEKSVEIEQLAAIMNQLPNSKSLRLLSCNDITSAKALSKQLPGRTLYASDGWVDLYSDGVITSENKFKKLSNGEEFAEVGMDGSSSSTKKIRLGEEITADVGKKAELLAKIDNLNAASLRNWVNRLNEVEDAVLLRKIDDLAKNDPAKLTRLNEVYKTMSMPAGKSGMGNFTITVNGKNVYYDKNGFPDFRPYSGNSSKGKIVFNKKNPLDGTGKDMTAANKWAVDKDNGLGLGPDEFRPQSNGTCLIKDTNGDWIEHTWHHHQDGKTMFPVPSKIHNVTLGGARHTGGAKIIEKLLIGFFESPIF